jgi:hypothetical protein
MGHFCCGSSLGIRVVVLSNEVVASHVLQVPSDGVIKKFAAQFINNGLFCDLAVGNNGLNDRVALKR